MAQHFQDMLDSRLCGLEVRAPGNEHLLSINFGLEALDRGQRADRGHAPPPIPSGFGAESGEST